MCLIHQDQHRGGSGGIFRTGTTGGQCAQQEAKTPAPSAGLQVQPGIVSQPSIRGQSLLRPGTSRTNIADYFGKACAMPRRGDQGAQTGPYTPWSSSCGQEITTLFITCISGGKSTQRNNRRAQDGHRPTSQCEHSWPLLCSRSWVFVWSEHKRKKTWRTRSRPAALGWRDPAVGWKYQRWDPTVKALVEDSSRAPISDQTAASHRQALSNHGAGHCASLFVQGQARGHQRSGDDFSDGLVHQNPGCSRGVVGSDGIVGLQTPTVERLRLQARDIATEPDGQEDLRSRLRALRLVLHNPGNSC